jgi:hypothetical protein
MEKQPDNNSSHNFEVEKFIGNQHLTDIREIKNHQRNITFQYILITLAIAGLTKIDQINDCNFGIKATIVIFGLIVIGFIWTFQKSLSESRRRINNIWKEPYFNYAMEKEFLNVDKKKPEKYVSPWYKFQYALVYILLVIMVMVSLLFIL